MGSIITNSTHTHTYQVERLIYCFHESLPDSLPPPVAFSPPIEDIFHTTHHLVPLLSLSIPIH